MDPAGAPSTEPTSAKRFAVLSIEGPPPAMELVLARLLDFDCLGTEELDPSSLRAYFPPDADVGSILTTMRERIPDLRGRVEPSVEDRDWMAEWKAALQGFEVGARYFVLPSWRERPETDRRVFVLDPERAFGTGTHETTSLEVELIEAYQNEGDSVLDLGTGTGLLAMVAACEGARSVLAIESDPDAARCARRNVARNELDERVRVQCGRLEELDELRADTVVANIQSDVLLAALPRMYGRLLLSGILAEEVDGFLARMPPGTTLMERRERGEWVALALERKDDARA